MWERHLQGSQMRIRRCCRLNGAVLFQTCACFSRKTNWQKSPGRHWQWNSSSGLEEHQRLHQSTAQTSGRKPIQPCGPQLKCNQEWRLTSRTKSETTEKFSGPIISERDKERVVDLWLPSLTCSDVRLHPDYQCIQWWAWKRSVAAIRSHSCSRAPAAEEADIILLNSSHRLHCF